MVCTNTKIALAAVLILGAASAALANDVETSPSEPQSAREWAQYLGQKQKHENVLAFNGCPTLEGYPDCHPDGRAWTPYSTTGESMARKKNPPKVKDMRRDRKSDDAWVPIPAPM
jgi:hypothetical protein